MFRVAVVALALLSASPCLAQGGGASDLRTALTARPFKPLVASHRAQAGVEARIFPENSLAAMELAVNRDVAIIEIDLRLTRDGVYILMHDPTLNRTTDVMDKFADRAERDGKHKGEVLPASLTLEEVKTLRLTDGFDGGEHRVPTAREALAFARNRVFLDLDLKEFDLEKLRALAAEFGSDNLMAYHGDADLLDKLNEATGIIPLPVNARVSKGGDPVADFDRYRTMFGNDFLVMHTRIDDISPALAAHAEKHGVRLWLNTLEEPDEKAEHFDYGAWNAHIRTGANVFQSDLASELTRYLDARTKCVADAQRAVSEGCAVFELEKAD